MAEDTVDPQSAAHRAPYSQFAASLDRQQKAEVVRDIYKKHATELLELEEAQQKLTLLLLGVFGAGASFLASEKAPLTSLARVGLTVIVVGILGVGFRYTRRRDRARASVRNLLVDCEKALGVFDVGVYRPRSPLYTVDPEKKTDPEKYAEQGGWLSWTFAIAALAAIGFLIVLWAPYFTGVRTIP